MSAETEAAGAWSYIFIFIRVYNIYMYIYIYMLCCLEKYLALSCVCDSLISCQVPGVMSCQVSGVNFFLSSSSNNKTKGKICGEACRWRVANQPSNFTY